MDDERKYWDAEAETMPRAKLEEVQLARLQAQMRYAYEHSSLHRRVWDEAGVTPDQIKTSEDFRQRVPFIDKDMVRHEQQQTGDAYGGMLCVPEDQMVMVSTSSGTTGLPTFLPVTRRDLDTSIEQFARFYWGIGVRPADKFQLALFAWHRGKPPLERSIERLGAICVPMDLYPLPGEIARNYYVVRHLKPAFCHLVTIPLIEGMEEEARKEGLDPGEVFNCYRGVVWGGDVLSPGTRRRITERWRTEVFEFAGLGDLNFYCMECPAHDGMHVQDDMFLLEIVDPDTKQVLPPGAQGVLVITALLDEALPAIRWWSEDVCYLDVEPCRCGRTTTRIRYRGRQQYHVQVAGQSLFPSQITNVIEQIPEAGHGLFQIVKYAAEMPVLRLRVGYQPAAVADQAELRARLAALVEKDLKLRAEIELVTVEDLLKLGPPHKIPRIVEQTK